MVSVFERHRSYLQFFGIYLPGKGPHWIEPVARIQVGIIVTISLINAICTIGSMLWLKSDFAGRLISFESAFVSGLGATKIVVFFFNKADVHHLFTKLNDFTSKVGLSKLVLFVIKAYWASMTGVPIFWMVNALLSGEMRTPMPYWFPFEVNTMSRYIPTFTLGSVALWLLCYTNTIVDTAVLLITSQLCLRLMILRKSFELIGKSGKLYKNNLDEFEIKGRELIAADNDEDTLGLCVKEHAEIIRLVGKLQSLLKVIYFFQVFLSLMLSCVSIFALTFIEDASKDGFRMIPIFCAQYIQYFIYCWIGEQLTIHCEQLYFATYNNVWFQTDPKLRKSLSVVKEFTKRKVVIRGGYIFDMSHQMFLRVIQESVSYFMFLRTFTSK